MNWEDKEKKGELGANSPLGDKMLWALLTCLVTNFGLLMRSVIKEYHNLHMYLNLIKDSRGSHEQIAINTITGKFLEGQPHHFYYKIKTKLNYYSKKGSYLVCDFSKQIIKRINQKTKTPKFANQEKKKPKY